jgi:hypothetical protein
MRQELANQDVCLLPMNNKICHQGRKVHSLGSVVWIAAALIAVLALFASVPAYAQITFVQKTPTATLIPNGAGGGGGSLPITVFSTQPAAGNFIVVFVTLDHGTDNPEIPTVTDNAGGTYTLAKSFAISGGTALIYYRENITTVANFQVTVQWATGYVSAAAAEFSGVATSGSLEANPPSNSGTGTSVSTGAIVGTAPTDLYIGVFTNNNNAYTSITSGQTQLYNQPSNTNAAMGAEYLIGSGSQTLTWTTNPAYPWTAVGAGFKQAGSANLDQIHYRWRNDDAGETSTISQTGSQTVAIRLPIVTGYTRLHSSFRKAILLRAREVHMQSITG